MATNWDKLTAAQRQKRVQQLIGNPGTRRSIPTRYLPPAMRREREANVIAAQPVVPGSTLTNRQAGRQAEAQTTTRYAPLENELSQQLQRSQGVQQNIPQWFQQYRDLLTAANQGVQQGYQQAVGQIQQLQQGTGQVGAQQQQGINNVNTELQSLGGQANPALAQTAAQGAAVRSANAGLIGGVAAAQGAGANAYGQNLVANTGRHQIDAILNELTKERGVRTDQASLARERGAYRTQARQQIADTEQKNVLERAAFNLDVTQEANRATEAAADDTRQTNQRNQDLVGPGQQYTRAAWNKMSLAERRKAIRDYEADTRNPTSTGPGGVAPATPTTVNTANTQVARAIQVATQAKNHGITRRAVESSLRTGQESRTRLNERKYEQLRQRYEARGMRPADARARAKREATERGMAFPRTDDIWTQVALDMAYDGHVSREAARRMHAMGINVNQVRGVVSYQDWIRRNPPVQTAPPRPGLAPGAGGSLRPT